MSLNEGSARHFQGTLFQLIPDNSLGSAESVRLPSPLTHHQVVINGKLVLSFHPSVQDILLKVGR